MATNRENALELLRSAGKVLCEAGSSEELERYVAAFREGIGRRRSGAVFAPVQLVVERRPDTVEAPPGNAQVRPSRGLRHVSEVLADDPLVAEARLRADSVNHGGA